MDFILGQKIRDKYNNIEGTLINVLHDEKLIHVEYEKYKGDPSPYVLEYDIDDENIIPLIQNKEPYKLNQDRHKYGLTVGDIRKAIDKSNLPDNAYVLIEHTNTGEKELITFNHGTPYESDFKKGWSANTNEDNLFIWINY